MFRQILRPVVQNTRTGVRSYYMPPELRPPHMNEVPVPSGSWQESYDKANQRYNIQLAAGIISLIAVIAYGRSNGTLWLNFLPPKPKPKEE